MQLLDGKYLSAIVKAEIKIETDKIKAEGGKTPILPPFGGQQRRKRDLRSVQNQKLRRNWLQINLD